MAQEAGKGGRRRPRGSAAVNTSARCRKPSRSAAGAVIRASWWALSGRSPMLASAEVARCARALLAAPSRAAPLGSSRQQSLQSGSSTARTRAAAPRSAPAAPGRARPQARKDPDPHGVARLLPPDRRRGRGRCPQGEPHHLPAVSRRVGAEAGSEHLHQVQPAPGDRLLGVRPGPRQERAAVRHLHQNPVVGPDRHAHLGPRVQDRVRHNLAHQQRGSVHGVRVRAGRSQSFDHRPPHHSHARRHRRHRHRADHRGATSHRAMLPRASPPAAPREACRRPRRRCGPSRWLRRSASSHRC